MLISKIAIRYLQKLGSLQSLELVISVSVNTIRGVRLWCFNCEYCGIRDADYDDDGSLSV